MALPSSTTEPAVEPNPKDNPEDSQAQEQDESTTVAEQESEDTSQASETAEADPEETSSEDESQESDKSDADAELKEWAAKKNLPLDDPLKLAKMYRESEKQLGKKGQQEGQLKAAVTTANAEAGTDDVQALRNELTALSFKVDHPEAGPLEGEMVSILEEKPWLANDLDAVLDIAKGRSVSKSEELLAARQAGKKEGLTAAEKAGRAAPPRASASQPNSQGSQKITAENVDELIARNGQKWFVDHRDEINAVLAG